MNCSLEIASEKLRDDKEVVMEAMEQGQQDAINFTSDRLKNDKEVAMKAIALHVHNLKEVNPRLIDFDACSISLFGCW
jgi:hypothetical protein